MLALRSADRHPRLIAWLGQPSRAMGRRRLVWDAAEPPTVKADWASARPPRRLGFPTSFLFLSPQEKEKTKQQGARPRHNDGDGPRPTRQLVVVSR